MGIRKYLYDGNTVLQETDGAGVTQTAYTSTADGYGDLLSEFDGAAARYYEPDVLGSTDALSNDAQTVTDRWSYRAFGAATHTTGSSTTPFTWVGRQGYQQDSETGLSLLGSGTRYYDPATAQFLSKDPIEFQSGDPNLYRYVANRPVMDIDPSGLAPTKEQWEKAKMWRLTNANIFYRLTYSSCMLNWEMMSKDKRCSEADAKKDCERQAREVWFQHMQAPIKVGDKEVVVYKDCLRCNKLKDQMETKINNEKLPVPDQICARWTVITATYACVTACELDDIDNCDVKGGELAFEKQINLGNKECSNSKWKWFTVNLKE